MAPAVQGTVSESVVSSRPRGRRGWRTSILGTVLVAVMVSTGVGIGRASGSSGSAPTGCEPGWYWIGEADDSFLWQETWLPLRSVSWTGSVQLLEEYDADCFVVGIAIAYTGPTGGGALALQGSLFVSYTVQYPDPFADYADVALNAYGDLDNWSPWSAPAVQPHFDINDRGADEFFVQGSGGAVFLTGVSATFLLPTDLLGSTVYAQIHVGWNLCECSVTPIFLPGQAPPPPEPAFDFDLSVSPMSGSVSPGGSVSADVTATLTSGAPNQVMFSASGLPADAVATFAPSECEPTCTTVMTISASTTTPEGRYDVEVDATDGSTLRTAAYSLTVESPPPPPPPTEVWSVYVHAHQDDWQLFEAPNPRYDYVNGSHLLFIYVSAGDAGGGLPWQAREEAAKASVRELIGTGLQEGSVWANVCHDGGGSQVCHNIWTWTYDRTVSAFMRTPDGGVLGGGFSSNNYESLSKLRDGNISSVTTVDRSTTYNSWEDFFLTLKALIDTYAPYDSTTTVNAPDFDRDRQTSQGDICTGCLDHADHLAVADAVYAITVQAGTPWTRFFFIDYPLGFADPRYPINLGSVDYDIKRRLFLAYRDEMVRLTGIDEYASMPWFWENCFHRDHYRAV